MKKIFTLFVLCFLCSQHSFAQCAAQLTPTGPLTVCQYETISLSATPGADNYEWIVNGLPVMSGTADNYMVPTSVPNTFTYQVNATFGTCTVATNSVTITINPQPAPPIVDAPVFCQYTVGNLQATGVNLLWYATQIGGVGTSITPVPNTTIPGVVTFWVSQTVNGCESERAALAYIVSPSCDSVWPGDVNYDLITDNNDALDLALYNGETGQARGTITINWSEQICQNWNATQVNGENMKHADCDGDGTVDVNVDVAAINQNYGLIHPKGIHLPQAKSTSLPDLYFDLTGITFTAGTTVNVPIKLGTNALPMNNILGIAAKIKVQNVTLDNAPTITNTTSWIGNSGNTMNFYKGVTNNQTDWALARTDHSNISGDGTIATLVMDIPAGSSGDAILYFDDVKIINNAGQEITDYNVIDDTATIVPVTINSTIKTNGNITIAPNPSQGKAELQISMVEATSLQIHITDMMGKQVCNNIFAAPKGNSNIILPSHLAAGIYSIQVRGTAAPAMKWVKQ